MEPKDWNYLFEVASELGCTATQLIKLIYERQIPLYVVPTNWYAHVWTYTRVDDNEFYDFIDFDHETFHIESNHAKPAHPVNPLPLSNQNVQALHIKGIIREDVFLANDTVKSDGSTVSYFKLCEPQDYTKNFIASIQIEDVVISSNHLKKLKAIVSEHPITKPLSDNQKDKLHRMIGLLTLLISKKASKYSNSGIPNYTNISEDLLKELKEIDKENKLETLGLGDTNLRTAMSDAVKLLHGKKI